MKTLILTPSEGVYQPELEVEVIKETEVSVEIKHEFFGISPVWFNKKTGLAKRKYDRKFPRYIIKGEV